MKKLILICSWALVLHSTSCNAFVCQDNKPILYLFVDSLPLFDQGKSTFDNFLFQNQQWPTGFDGQGSVLVSFVVQKDGQVSKVRIERSLCKPCDEEVIRLINLMPLWKPGKLEGRYVDVLIYLPVFFRID